MKNMATFYGTFAYEEYNTLKSNAPTLVFLTSLGPNNSYYDYYDLFEQLKSANQYNLISLDLLGRGFSSDSKEKSRSIENISKEILAFIDALDYNNIIFCCHSFSALYILNIVENKNIPTPDKIKAFIGIDPTSADIMEVYKNELVELAKEAKEGLGQTISVDERDINPLLSPNKKIECKEMYAKLISSGSSLLETEEASNSIHEMKGVRLTTLPSLSILSSLNLNDYKKFGNPYFNSNSNSMECVINSHHYIHWTQPTYVCGLIKLFTKNVMGGI